MASLFWWILMMPYKNVSCLLPLYGPQPVPEHGDYRLLLMKSVGHVLPHRPLFWPVARIGTVNLPEAPNRSLKAFEDLGSGLVYASLRGSVHGAVASSTKTEVEAPLSIEEACGPGQLFTIHGSSLGVGTDMKPIEPGPPRYFWGADTLASPSREVGQNGFVADPTESDNKGVDPELLPLRLTLVLAGAGMMIMGFVLSLPSGLEAILKFLGGLLIVAGVYIWKRYD